MSKWINVKDRLPPIYNILDKPLTGTDGKPIKPLFVSIKVLRVKDNVITAGHVEWFENSSYINSTHWMPLPSPPKDK